MHGGSDDRLQAIGYRLHRLQAKLPSVSRRWHRFACRNSIRYSGIKGDYVKSEDGKKFRCCLRGTGGGPGTEHEEEVGRGCFFLYGVGDEEGAEGEGNFESAKLVVIGDTEMIKTSTQIIKRVLLLVAKDMRKDYLWSAFMDGRGGGEGGGEEGVLELCGVCRVFNIVREYDSRLGALLRVLYGMKLEKGGGSNRCDEERG